MVLTKSELIVCLQEEVRVLLHLAGKIDRAQLDYRPTPKQRSTLELLKYLSFMGPALVRAAAQGTFDPAVWTAEEEAAQRRDFDQTLAALAAQKDTYADLIGALSDADFRTEIQLWGPRMSRGVFIVTSVLSGCAAYRTQIFLYLKACGREELTTWNLWRGMDAPPADAQ
jgi:hypothetical protein